MSARILGVSAFYHDSAAALVRDGQLVAACAEDRFSRVKHDSSLPMRAAQFCLAQGDLAAHELDAVVFYERPDYKFLRVLRVLLSGYPRGGGRFARGIVSWISEKLWVRTKLSDALDVDPAIIRFVEHHTSHAAYAFYASPYARAALLTLDGVGEDTCGSIGIADRAQGIRALESTPYPHSLGLVYAAITGYLGFRPNDAECSTMALAAFGKPQHRELFERLIACSEGQLRIAPGHFDFAADHSHSYLPALRRALGPPRHDAAAGFSALADNSDGTPATSREAADIAASLQLRTEEVTLALARRARELTGEQALCFGGGVAFNAVAVGRLLREGGFAGVFVPPDPGDGGGAIGAALLESARRGVVPAAPGSDQIYSGPRAQSDSVATMLPHLDPPQWATYAMEGVSAVASLSTQAFDDDDALGAWLAERIAGGAIAGWMSGGSEFGPRALGARSILCDPADLATAHRLSRLVKRRAAFRPYALSVADYDAECVFGADWRWPPYRWMQATAPVRPEMRQAVRAALHIDGTTRPQVCAHADHPAYFTLLRAFGARRGLAALLNTSLNDAGEPLAATAEDALLMFARTDMDLLVVDRQVIEKRRP
ncbi:MAG: hypothetical protein J0M21_11895 [Xanthomonadales bacterium]|nr:hypothetical protein [Xanthomonadales bacterium]